jgi:transposase
VIGILVAGNGIPIAHHLFPGDTRDSTTLSAVMADYEACFGVGKIALVAGRGLISEQNLADVREAGFDHVLATRLHHDAEPRRCSPRRSAWAGIAGRVCWVSRAPRVVR